MTGPGRFSLPVTARLLDAFAHLTGDYSPIHVDPEFARLTRFRAQVAHGMLPVLCCVAACAPAGRGLWRLRDLSCRFANPCPLGETVLCRGEAREEADGSLLLELQVTGADGSVRTSGAAHLVQRTGNAADPGPTGDTLASGLVLNERTLAEMTPGLSETIAFVPSEPALRRFLQELGTDLAARADAVAGDAFLAASLMVSTLVGMRLPGRHATFMDCSLSFEAQAFDAGPVFLRGTVGRVLGGGGRISLDLAWGQGTRQLAMGRAAVMVGHPPAPGVSCADIRDRLQGFGLAGRVALVTGASRGIGEACAKLLAMQGVKVAVHYFQGAQAAERVVADIVAQGGTAEAFGADLADPAGPRTLFESVVARMGPVDILVNNAVGDFTPKPFDETTPADLLAELSVSLFGLHECCRLAVPHMRAQQWGKIVNLGTVAVDLPVRSQSKYIAAKSALVGYTRSLAVECASDGIQVNLVAPSMTQTTLLAGIPPQLLERLAADTPVGRLLQPIEVARAVAFLCSDWARAISGQQLVLSQGEAPFR